LSGLQFNISGIIGPALGGLLVPLAGANFAFALNAGCFLLVVGAARQWKQTALAAGAKASVGELFRILVTINRYVCTAPGFQAVLPRNLLFALFISVIPALMAVVGLRVLHLSSSNLRMLLISMGPGSVIGALFIIPWLRARVCPDSVTLSANAMPSWARGRMNATVIMISQAAMALGGMMWGSAASLAGASYTVVEAAVFFLTSLLLAPRLSINFAGILEERVSGVLARTVEPEAMTSIALTNHVLAA
jgi:hypothetical protein